ncbi:GPI transamidase component [Polyrhizophydium stewartii]|uniref:GPI transamidase component n=1 Tax=Polyrhizophydium stewartii TaxID=2732419 RepID=A0ABR4NBU8_9FUNG
MKVSLEPLSTRLFADRRTHIIVAIWLVLAFAAPVWWKTTEVYRAPLPFERIRQCDTPEALSLKLEVDIHLRLSGSAAASLSHGDAARVTEQVQRGISQVFSEAAPQSAGSRRVVLAFSVDGAVDPKSWPSDATPSDIDASLGKEHGRNGAYDVFVDCSSQTESVYVGQNRALFLQLPSGCSKDLIVSRTIATLSGLFGSEQRSLSKLYAGRRSRDIDYKSMRTVKYAPQYQIVLSLLVGNPQDNIVTWDIEKAANAYIAPFLESLSNISDFTITSQILNFAQLPTVPDDQRQSDGSVEFTMRPKSLTSFINSAEWNLASVVSLAPPINLILYIPPASFSPLVLLHTDGSPLASNAFLVPQWGGIVVRSLPKNTPRVHYSVDALHHIMEIFVEQLRGLLGVEQTHIVNSAQLLSGVHVQYASSPELGLTRWEVDRLFRARTVLNIVDAAQTLTSLANLLEQLSGMVVPDHIQTLVARSLDSIEHAKLDLEQKRYSSATFYARDAITSAEAAFFDPAMVPLLYFPDEHKFAIYMPYFVPVTVPVIIAIIREVRLRFGGTLSRRLSKKKTA